MPAVRFIFIWGVVICMSVFPKFVCAQQQDGQTIWQEDGESLCSAGNDQTWPQIVGLGNDSAVAVWQDNRDFGTNNSDIYAQRISLTSGATLWAEDGIAVCAASGEQSYPIAVSAGSGSSIIVWQDKRSGNFDIYAQKISVDGVTQWVTDGIAVSTATGDQGGGQWQVSVATDGVGGAIIVWEDKRESDIDIYAQRISADGERLWTDGGVIISTASDDQIAPVLVPDGVGGAIIIWQERNAPGASNADIYAQRISSSGVCLWDANGIAVCAQADDQWRPQVAADGSGGAIVVWQDDRVGNNYDNIYANRLNGNGQLLWGTSGVAVTSLNSSVQQMPVVCSHGDGDAVIAWVDRRNDDWGDIYVQKLNSSGIAQWTTDGNAVCWESREQGWWPAQQERFLNIAASPGDIAIVTWADYRGAANYDIYAQKMKADGTREWDENGTCLSSVTGDQQRPVLVWDGHVGAVIVWEDYRDGNYDIYTQKVTDADQDKPSAVTDLSATTGNTSDEIVLTWTAPGDDSSITITGQCDSYVLKYSTKTIVEVGGPDAWWAQSEEYPQEWTPLPQGETEQKNMYLLSNATYTFMIRGYDEIPNESDLSNATSTYARFDDVAPGSVQDLQAQTGSTEGKIDLTWTSPGDNGTSQWIITGAYHIQYSSFVVDFSTSDAQISQNICKKDIGTSEALTLTGLTAGTTYFIRLWTRDEVPNFSPISIGATTWAQWDITEPATVTDLSVPLTCGTSVYLSWTAPGDDGWEKPLSSGTFRICYAQDTGNLTLPNAQFSISTSCAGVGEYQLFPVTELSEDTTYFFSLWSADEMPNWSGGSNVVTTKSRDFTAPDAITTLSALTGTDEGEIELSWIAPGDNGTNGALWGGIFRIDYSTEPGYSWEDPPLSQYEKDVATDGCEPTTLISATVGGLIKGATYYVRVWTRDESDNWSALSNGATSWAMVDEIAPQAVQDLEAHPGDSCALLAWTAPGDNGKYDNFVETTPFTPQYFIRYSSWGPITNWDDALPVTGLSPAPEIPTPYIALASTHTTITGLTNFTTYWFALRTRDESNNISNISNIPFCIPSPDQTPPELLVILAPPDEVNVPGSRVVMKVSATDDNLGVTAIDLYWRKMNTSVFQSSRVYSSFGTTATGEITSIISGDWVLPPGIEYFFRVIDTAQNWKFSTDGSSGTYPAPEEPGTLGSIVVDITRSQYITSYGGEVKMVDGDPTDGSTVLTIPADALSEGTTISITWVDPSSVSGSGGVITNNQPVQVCDIAPESAVFAVRSTLQMLYQNSDNNDVVDGTSIEENTLSLFHWDGHNWRYFGGKICDHTCSDASKKNTVRADVSHLGRWVLFASSGEPEVAAMRPLRTIITPATEDGINDYAEWAGLEVPFEIKIYNRRGRLIRKLIDIPRWDGDDEDGNVVESGVYIYQFKKDKELISGIIVVAK